MKWLLLILILSVSGCGLNGREQLAFGSMIAGQAADYCTTVRNLRAGASEQNPILGDRPSDDTVLLFRVAVVGAMIGLGELNPEYREFWYWLGGISGGGAAIYNHIQYEEHK
jgi:hypothetical protein